MKHLLHQFHWQVRRRRALLAIHASLWFVLTWLAWELPATSAWEDNLYFHLHVVLLAMTALLTLECAGSDPARGTDTFWRTHPPRWLTVWLAQVVFVIVALAGPALACWVVNGLMLNQTPAQWLTGLVEPAGIVSALLVLAALRSLGGGWTATAVALGAAGGLISAGATLLNHRDNDVLDLANRPLLSYTDLSVGRDALIVVACLVPAAAIAAVWAASMRGRVSRIGFGSATVWLVAAPALVWILLSERLIKSLQLAVAVPGEISAAEEQPLGVVKLRGIPDGHRAAIQFHNLTAGWSEASAMIKDQDRPRLRLSRAWQPAPNWLTPRTGERLRSGFPAATRWYSDGTGESGGSTFELEQWGSPEPMPARLRGSVAGHLVAPAQGFAVKLEKGSAAAGRGTRLRIHEVTAGSRNLQIECDIWEFRAASDWEGKGAEGLLVLHLPAVPAAVLTREEPRLPFRSLQCAGSRTTLRVTMPDAEFASGIRFTAEVLRGAELWHFAPGEKTLFKATPEEGVVLLHPAARPPASPRLPPP